MSGRPAAARTARLARAVAVLLGGTGGLSLGLLVLLTTPAGNEVVRVQALRAFAGAFPGAQLEVERLRTRLFDGLTLTGVTLRTAQGQPLLSARELHLRWDLRGALRERLVLPQVLLVAPTLDLGPGPGGRLALLEALGVPPSEGGPPRAWAGIGGEILVRSLEIRDGTVSWPGGALEGLSLRAAGRVAGRTVEVRGLSARGHLSGPVLADVALDGALALQEGDLSLTDLRLDLGGSRAGVSGRVEEVETAPVLDLELDVYRLQPADVEDLLGGATPAQDLAARGALRGPLRALEAGLEVDAGGGGRLLAGAQVDLHTPDASTTAGVRPAWRVDLSATPLDLQALYPHLFDRPVSGEEVQLTATGSGLGGAAGLAAWLHLRVDGARLWDEPVPALEATASLAREGLWLHGATLTHAAGRVRAAGPLSLSQARATLDLDVELLRLSALSERAGTALDGALRWRPALELAWAGAPTVQAQGPMHAVRLDVAGVRVGDAAGPTRLSWAGGALELGGGLSARDLSASGVALDHGEADWTLRWSGAQGARVEAQVRGGAVTMQQSAARVDGIAAKVVVDLPPGGTRRVEVEGRIEGLAPTGDPQALVGQGPVRLVLAGERVEGQVGLTRPDGGALLLATVQGDLAGTSTWTLRDLVLEPLPGLRWEAPGPSSARLGPDGLLALDATLDGPAGRLQASLGDDRHLRLQAEALRLAELARLQALAPGAAAGAPPPPVEGSAAFDLDATLDPRGRPVALQGQVQVEGLGLQGRLHGVDAALRAEGPLEALALGLDLRASGERTQLLTARGTVPLDPAGAGLACGAPLALRIVLPPTTQEVLALHLPSVPPGPTRLSGDLRIDGDACDPDLALVAAADAPAGPEGRVLRADLDLAREAAQLTLRAVVEEGFRTRLLATGTAGTAASARLRDLREGRPLPALSAPGGVEGWVDQVSLSLVPVDLGLQDLRAFFDLPPALGGRLAGGFQLSGSPRAPSVSGAVQLIDGRLGGARVDSALLMVMPGEGGYDLSLDASLGALDGASEQVPTSLQLRGFVPVDLQAADLAAMRATPGLDLSAQGALPLSVLEGLVDPVQDTAGALAFSARATGSLAAPVVQGDLSMEGGALSWVPLGLAFEEISLAARVADDRVHLQHLTLSNRKRLGLLGSGRPHRLSASGQARLAGGRLAEVEAGSVTLDNFWLIATRDHEVALSGDLALHGPWPGLRMEGDLRLDGAQLFFDEEAFVGDRRLELDPALTVHRTRVETVARTAQEEGPALWQQVEVDVALDLQRNLRLNATVPTQEEYGEQVAQLSSVSLDADLGGQLRVIQREGALALQGEIEPTRGSATVFGVPFDLTGGTISFVGDGYDDPLIDLQAARVAGTYGQVDVHVTGSVQDMQIDLSSEQYPDKKDVVTLLLFGKPASEMADSEGQAGAQLVAASLSALSGQLERAVGTSVFDELEIDPAGAIRIGWALSDRAFLRVESRGATSDVEDNRFEVTLEYLISRRLYAELTTGDRAASSANLYWRWRF
ncbi:translocation/assembly module TamB [Myxococcota bacterium]|nr:translocation/assembly module TamB [Myxococcota bacterium]